jgi:predicted transcriptional regulator
LAAEAITAFVTRELDMIEAIEVGLVDIEAGRVFSHEDGMRDVRAEIEASRPKP